MIVPIPNQPVKFSEDFTALQQRACCYGTKDFCQKIETSDETNFQIQLTETRELACQTDFINIFTDGDYGTMEADIAGLDTDLGVLGQTGLQAHTGSFSCRLVPAGFNGVAVRGTTILTLEAHRRYYFKAWFRLDGYSFVGTQRFFVNTEGFADATVTVLLDKAAPIAADTWFELITQVDVGAITTGRLVVENSGLVGIPGNIDFDDIGVTCWELDQLPLGRFQHDWINSRLNVDVVIQEGFAQQELDIREGWWYGITIETTGTSIRDYEVLLGGNSIIFAGVAAIPDYFIMQAGDLNNLFEIRLLNAGASGDYIDSISIKEYSIPSLCTINCETGDRVCHEYDPNVGYGYAYEDAIIDIETIDNILWAFIRLTWEGYAKGCYQICLYDLADEQFDELILNGNFRTDSEWVTGIGNTISGGTLNMNGGAGGSFSYIDTDQTLEAGKCYTLEFDVSNIAGGATLAVQLRGAGSPDLDIDINITTNGHKTYNIILTDDYTRLYLAEIVPFGTLSIDNVTLTLDLECADSETCTECYCVADEWGCSLLLSWTNNENAFGFNYDFDFMQFMRVEAKLLDNFLDKDKEVFTNSAGNRKILYSSSTEKKKLIIGDIPLYMHQALGIGLEHDDFFIDGTRYINEEDSYTPNWRKTSVLAPVEVEVIEDDQFLTNSNC